MLTLSERARSVIENFADEAIKEIQYAIRNRPTISGAPANASGAAADSMEKKWEGTELIISGEAYIFALEFGRKPTEKTGGGGMSLKDRIRIWIDHKGIGFGKTEKQKQGMAWAISTNIHKNGTLLWQSIKNGGKPSGTLSDAINDQKIIKLGKQVLDIFAVEAVSLLLGNTTLKN